MIGPVHSDLTPFDIVVAERDRLKLEIEQCHAKSTCCCGDYMKHHSVYSGHSAVSMYDNALSNIEAERDRLLAVNEGLVKALENIAQIQRDKCENASAEMLFILLDNKVGIAHAALDASQS